MLIFIIIPIQSYILTIEDYRPHIKGLNAELRFDMSISQLKSQNQDSYCPSHNPECWIFQYNEKYDQFEYMQLHLDQFVIEDQVEIFKFHQIPDEYNLTNKIALSPFSTYMNSFVYFGYSMCISEIDGYYNKGFNNKDYQNGINLQLYEIYYEQQLLMAFRLNYLEIFNQKIDISQYDIIFDQTEFHSIFPLEIMNQLNINQNHPEIAQHGNIENYFIYDRLAVRGEKMKFDTSIKFYNEEDYYLEIQKDLYICYECQEDFDSFLFLIKNQKEIVLGNQFLVNKIFHVDYDNKSMILQQLKTDSCFDVDLSISKNNIIILIILFTLTVYFIIRYIRYKNILKQYNNTIQFHQMVDQMERQENQQ